MSLWYTFKLSLNLEVVAKNGMRKNATEQHHLLIYTMHDISRGFLKQRDRRYKSPSAHISGIYKSSKIDVMKKKGGGKIIFLPSGVAFNSMDRRI